MSYRIAVIVFKGTMRTLSLSISDVKYKDGTVAQRGNPAGVNPNAHSLEGSQLALISLN